MFSATDDSDAEFPSSLRPALQLDTQPYRTIRRQHKRYSSDALGTLGPLPEYHSPPVQSQSLLSADRPRTPPLPAISWQQSTHAVSPPPTYPGLTNRSPATRKSEDYLGDYEDAGEPEEERDIVPSPIPTIRPRRILGRRRSVAGSIGTTEDKLDSLLERSIAALEASNQLLQSSLSTHSSLAAVLADSASDRGMDLQIRYLAKRLGVGGEEEDKSEKALDKVLDGVLGLLGNEEDNASASNAAGGVVDGGVSRSLPAEDHMVHLRSRSDASRSDFAESQQQHQRRLRLSAGERPRSPPPRPFTQYVSIESPFGVALEATASSNSIYMPSTSGTRTTPRETHLSSRTPRATSPSISSLPHHPTTPKSGSAYTMLSQIVSRSSSASRSNSPDIVRTFGPAFLASPSKSKGGEGTEPGRGRGGVPHRPSSGRNPVDVPIPRSASDTTWARRSHSQSSDLDLSPSNHRHTSSTSSAPGVSSSMFDLRSPIDEVATANMPALTTLVGGLRRAQVGDKLPPSSYKVAVSLRKILAESEKQTPPPVSEVAQGKQRAEGERPEFGSTSRRSRSASANTRPPALAISAPSVTLPVITHEDGSLVEVEPHRSPALASEASLPSTASTENTGIQQPLPPSPPTSPPATPRRSALKGSSGRNTPLSSGQSSPRVVTFSPLPPKHESSTLR